MEVFVGWCDRLKIHCSSRPYRFRAACAQTRLVSKSCVRVCVPLNSCSTFERNICDTRKRIKTKRYEHGFPRRHNSRLMSATAFRTHARKVAAGEPHERHTHTYNLDLCAECMHNLVGRFECDTITYAPVSRSSTRGHNIWIGLCDNTKTRTPLTSLCGCRIRWN